MTENDQEKKKAIIAQKWPLRQSRLTFPFSSLQSVKMLGVRTFLKKIQSDVIFGSGILNQKIVTCGTVCQEFCDKYSRRCPDLRNAHICNAGFVSLLCVYNTESTYNVLDKVGYSPYTI